MSRESFCFGRCHPEEPGRLQFMGSQRVIHDWATNTHTHTHMHTHTHRHPDSGLIMTTPSTQCPHSTRLRQDSLQCLPPSLWPCPSHPGFGKKGGLGLEEKIPFFLQHLLRLGSYLGQFFFLNTFLLSDVQVSSKTGSPQKGRRSTFSGTVTHSGESVRRSRLARGAQETWHQGLRGTGNDSTRGAVCPINCPRQPPVYLPSSSTFTALSYSPPPCAALEIGCCCCWVATLCPILLWLRLLCPWNFPGKDTWVGYHFFLQRLFPTQESNPGLLLGRQILPQSEPPTWEAPEIGMEQSYQLEELQIECWAKDRWNWEKEKAEGGDMGLGGFVSFKVWYDLCLYIRRWYACIPMPVLQIGSSVPFF